MIVEGKKIAASILKKIKKGLKDRKVRLVSLSLRGSAAYQAYQKSQKKIADYLGVDYRPLHCRSFSEAEVEKVVKKLNRDRGVHGIIVELPLPRKIKFELIAGILDPRKDIEGISVINQGRLFSGRPFLVSPTALACFYIIKTLVPRLYGKNVTIVGASNLIGKPLAHMLLRDMATVSVTHIATSQSGNLPWYTRRADILVSAAGKPGLITKDMVGKNAVVLDVGVSRKGREIVGDVVQEAGRKCRHITPVPGGVGPVTTAFLFSNLLKAFLVQKGRADVQR